MCATKMAVGLLLGIVFLFINPTTSAVVVPEPFLGSWAGVPSASTLGPFTNNFTFSISKANNGDYLFEDNFAFDHCREFGWQRFYMNGETGGMYFCGTLGNFTSDLEAAGITRLEKFKVVKTQIFISPNNYVFLHRSTLYQIHP